MDKASTLSSILETRVKMLPKEISRRIIESEQTIVFGSFASGLNRPCSDIDIFCIGPTKTHFKTKPIEIMILPEFELYSELWLGSELANHITGYGIPIQNKQIDWFKNTNVSDEAYDRKLQRVKTYIKSLERYWLTLSLNKKARYEITVRRELQRLNLIARKKPTPPTAVLDLEISKGRVQLFEHLSLSERQRLTDLFPSLSGY